jgi:hypothetical protein
MLSLILCNMYARYHLLFISNTWRYGTMKTRLLSSEIRVVRWKSTDVSRNKSPPSSGLKNKPSKKPAWKQVVSRSPYFSTLKMEAACSSETSVDIQRTTRRYIPEDRTLLNHGCENLRSYKWKQKCKTVHRRIMEKETWHPYVNVVQIIYKKRKCS